MNKNNLYILQKSTTLSQHILHRPAISTTRTELYSMILVEAPTFFTENPGVASPPPKLASRAGRLLSNYRLGASGGVTEMARWGDGHRHPYLQTPPLLYLHTLPLYQSIPGSGPGSTTGVGPERRPAAPAG